MLGNHDPWLTRDTLEVWRVYAGIMRLARMLVQRASWQCGLVLIRKPILVTLLTRKDQIHVTRVNEQGLIFFGPDPD
jgi:hypothetical protein